MNHPWQYDETIQIGTDYCDPTEVAAYDRRMQLLRDIPAEVTAIIKALSLANDASVWEIGTGTGECALTLAASVKQVYATDVSPTMLEYARRKAEQRRIGNVTFDSGGFLSGFRPPYPVDAVVTQLSLHHLPDFWKARALTMIAGCLRPHGRLYLRDVVFPSTITDYDSYFRTVTDGIRSQAGDDVAMQTMHHIKTEFSTFDWILEGMIARSGLRLVDKEDKGFLSVYVCEKE